MKEQLDLLNKICDEFFSLQENFDFLEFIYKFNPDEGWIGTELFTSKKGIVTPIILSELSEDKIKLLCNQLHTEMKSHTGGDWRKMILNIVNGEVKTEFVYEVQSCMDQFK